MRAILAVVNNRKISTQSVAARAREAARVAPLLASASLAVRNEALQRIRTQLWARRAEIAAANQDDLTAAEQAALAPPLLKRLRFQEAQLRSVCAGIDVTRGLPDPLGHVQEKRLLDTGLLLQRRSVPIGTIGVVFESRPDALVQIASLCLKSGNCCLMKGGREAARTNALLAEIITAATAEHLPPHWLSLLTTRDEVDELITCAESIDLLIPRGSNAFVRSIMKRSAIPVLGHADGVCHVYIDHTADPEMAERVMVDAKTQYPAVCNAAECMLIHRDVATVLLPRIVAALRAGGVVLHGCARSRAIAAEIMPAAEEHWGREYLALELSVRVVDALDAAIAHINRYGSKHTDAIVTADTARAERFMRMVDSSSVLHNCSTRFSDGYRYGLGAEVGVSTAKIHARGPVGLMGLVSYKWQLEGRGHVVADYSGDNAKPFLHQEITR